MNFSNPYVNPRKMTANTNQRKTSKVPVKARTLRIYDSDAPANASVEAIATVGGYNEWFTGGWTGNEYTDRVHFTASGSQNGWIVANRYTETGRRNYSSPEPFRMPVLLPPY